MGVGALAEIGGFEPDPHVVLTVFVATDLLRPEPCSRAGLLYWGDL